MASYIDMSLEDIIKKRKRENLRTKGPAAANRLKKDMPTHLIDARNKIILKKRTKIADARDKLAELAKKKDARLKLEQLRMKRPQAWWDFDLISGSGLMKEECLNDVEALLGVIQAQVRQAHFFRNHGKTVKNIISKERVFTDPSRHVASQPLHQIKMSSRRQINTKKFMENRSIGTRSSEKPMRLKPILRTVENDLEIIDDPMDDKYVSSKTSALNRKANLQLRIIARNNDVRESRSSNSHRLSTPEKERSPPRPPSILKKRPMAALRSDKKAEKPSTEYRIIVSNLRNTVTGGDIEELFGDVGGMVESRLVRPGTAEVLYKSMEDAQRAVELYHNRQLDGQPMNCLLVTPRSTAASTRTSSKPALISSNSNVEPDISTFHKVLFSSF